MGVYPIFTEFQIPFPNSPQKKQQEIQVSKKAELGALPFSPRQKEKKKNKNPKLGIVYSPHSTPSRQGNWSWELGQLNARGMNVMGPRRLQQMAPRAQGSGVLLHSTLLKQKELSTSDRKHHLGREGMV